MEDVDSVWYFIFALVGLVCGIVAGVMSWRHHTMILLLSIGLTAISLAGVLAWWP